MVFEKAQWIWNKTAESKNSFVDFLINFTPQKDKAYTLFISSCVNHMLTLNGKYVPSSQREGYEIHPEYQEVDLTDAVQLNVENELIITVYSQGIDSFIWRNRPAGVIFELYEETTLINFSSATTLSRINTVFSQGETHLISSMLGYAFSADLRKTPPEFTLGNTIAVDKNKNLSKKNIKDLDVLSPACVEIINQGIFLDSSPATTLPGTRAYHAFLSSRKITELSQKCSLGLYNNRFYLNAEKELTFNTDDNCDGIYLTLDLQENKVGYPCFEIEVEADTKLLVSYGEHLDDMRPRSSVASYEFAYEVYLKKGKNSFIFPIRRTCARYFMALIYSNKASVSYIGMRECLYPTSDVTTMVCSDSIHTKIFETAKRTLKLCMHDHYEDCPSREQAMYIMDSQIQAVCGYYALGEYTFPRSCFEMMLYSLKDNGYFEMIAPGKTNTLIPAFTLCYLPLVWEYYLFSRDLEFLEKCYPYLKSIIENKISAISNTYNLAPSPCGENFWNFTEWQKGNDGVVTPPDFTYLDFEYYSMPYNAFLSLACSSYAEICKTLKIEADAKKFDDVTKLINTSIHKHFWRSDKGAYASAFSPAKDVEVYFNELSTALAVCTGACPDNLIETALETLSSGELLPITTSHAKYKYDALLQHSDKYGDFVLDEISRIWGGMLYKEATSFWETENGARDFSLSGSMCHGWSATPIYVYFRYFLGIYPTRDRVWCQKITKSSKTFSTNFLSSKQ